MKKNNILIIGYKGMLGEEIYLYLKSRGINVIGFDKNDLDITNLFLIEDKIKLLSIDLIINCAAYTNVNNAETIDRLKNFNINSLGVYNLAKITQKYNIGFITFSSDYIFDGKKKGFNEYDIPNPLNNYGLSKLLGEKLAKNENLNTIIIRTSWLYGGKKGKFKNFFNFIVNSKGDLHIINDQYGAPTNVLDLTKAIYKIIKNLDKYIGKTFHLVNQGYTSWFGFSIEINKTLGLSKNIVIKKDIDSFIKRPKYSILINNSDIILDNRKDSLYNYIKNEYKKGNILK